MMFCFTRSRPVVGAFAQRTRLYDRKVSRQMVQNLAYVGLPSESHDGRARPQRACKRKPVAACH